MPRLQKRTTTGPDGKTRTTGYAAVFFHPRRHPREKYITLRTKNATLARRELKKMEDRLLEGWDPWEDAIPKYNITTSEAIELYIANRSDRRRKSLRADRSTLLLFDKSLPPQMPTSLIEERHVKEFLRSDLATTTRRTYLARLNTFFKWCFAQGYSRKNPAEHIKRPKLYRKEKPFLTREQVEQVIRTIETEVILRSNSIKDGELIWLIDVIRFAVGTGLRISELCALRWSGVNLSDQIITVRVTETFVTKSGHERMLPVRGDALDILERLSNARSSEEDTPVFRGRRGRAGDDSGLNPEYVSKRFLHFARLSSVPTEITFHTLRHTYVTWLVQKGVPLLDVKELAGHESITTTMQYAHHAPDGLSAAVEKVFAKT